ncbi:MAG: PAS domain S-box protein [Bacteroidota bacterium]
MKDKPVILIVDDQPQNIELFEAYLVPHGYEIVKAANGEEALGKLSGKQIDLILLDVMMPGMDGFEVTRRVRQDNTHRLLPIILITILRETEDRVKGIEAGCDEFISYPVDKMELLARVRSLLKVKAYNDLMSNYRKELESEVTRSTEELKHALENLQLDITERKQAEEELKKSEGKFRTIFDNTSDGMFLIDLNARKFFICNAMCVKMLGYTQEEFSTLDITDIHPNEDMSFINEQIGKFSRGEEGLRSDIRFKRKDKSIFAADLRPAILTITEKKYLLINFTDITERKQAEKQIALLAHTLKSVAECVSITDLNDIVLFVNIAFLKTYGYSEHEILGKNINVVRSLNNPPEATRGILATTLAGGWSGELMNRTKDGRDFPVSLSTSFVRDEQGQDIALVGIATDITERKRAEETLSKSEEKYRVIFENVQDVYYEVSIDGTILEISHSIEIMSKGQYHRDDLIGKSMYDFYSITGGRQALLELLQEQSIVTDYEVILKNRDGSQVPCSISAKIQFDAHSAPLKIIGSMRDITFRKRAEEALQESEVRFRSLYENATIGLYRTTPNGKILLANPALVKMLGYISFEKLAERNLEKDGFESFSQRKEFLEKIEKDGEVNGYESKWTCQDGTAIFVLESARAIRDSKGKTLYYDGTVEDITKRKLLEEQMRQMQKLEGLGTLAGGIAHDFNNILGIILGYSTSIKRFKDDPKKLDSAIKTITKAVDRGKTLVQSILTFARKTEIAFGAVNVNDVVMEIMTMILETFPKTLTYSQNFDKAVPYINADRSQLHQALLNLCVNARDAMPQGGVLTINTRMVSVASLRNQNPDATASSYVCIEVSDTGEGMSEEIRKRIFEPFFTTKEIGKGTGLGLSVVFGVVQSHKGFIDVDSELGKGATFRLYLPVSQVAKPIVEEAEETLEEIPGGTETLLVVEDEEMLLMPLQIVLVEKGYKILSAQDGFTALKIYKEKKNEIALVLTDLGLPNISGFEVCHKIKKINPNQHIILASGYIDPNMKSELLKVSIQHFLYKPYDFKIVLKMVREVLDEK